MNIFIPQSWLKDYIETDVSPVELAKKMSAHAFNVERTNEIKGDIVWEAEITTNRSDALSIMGIARELKSLLPKKDYKFKYKESKARAGIGWYCLMGKCKRANFSHTQGKSRYC